ncbi:hypothetical protein CH380_01395 [Leptospira adleri]|uniref:Uncharacterized protein n=1 Tax=Leptospira adleri TaxID=2023186 RepID=A0A2M9YUG8_9LEPT|nr:hypothetical protein CH380_01395 [Leptospira adleri]PJZ63427.1 hypothetical protein CH376_03030 [Leptospira adleri]
MFYRVSPDSRRPVIAKREFELIKERTKSKKIRYNFTWLSKERLAFSLPDTPKTVLKKYLEKTSPV